MKNKNYLYVKAHQDCDGDLFICDNTGFDKDGFKREDSTDTSDTRYKLSEVVLFTILHYHSSEKTSVTYTNIVEPRSEDIIKYKHFYNAVVKKQKVNIEVDGYYTLTYFAVPKSITTKGQFNYYVDENNNILNEQGEIVTFEEIDMCYSNIMYYTESFFFTNNLRNAFLKYVYNKIYSNTKGVLNKIKRLCCEGANTQDMGQEIMGSALAAIRYLIEQCRYEDAQIIIEQLSGCGDIYDNNEIYRTKYYGCGCH